MVEEDKANVQASGSRSTMDESSDNKPISREMINEKDIHREMASCHLCPRDCGVNRLEDKLGFCRVGRKLKVSRAALHMWEEPCISGKEGSGAVFFSGCNLGCVFCQNRAISRGESGLEITEERLAQIFLELQEQGANNINLVTGEHYAPQIAAALRMAKNQGLRLPVLYNSSGYESLKTLQMLEGLIDIYLPDFKYWKEETAKQYSHAPGYPQVVKCAIAEMVRQVGEPEFDERGMITKGVIVRHMLMPGHVKEGKEILKYLHETYGSRIYISMMSQYTPMKDVLEDPLLGRRVTEREYERLVDYALEIGIENGFTQERKVAMESFIPAFDGEGVIESGREEI